MQKFIVPMIGARRDYDVAKILSEENLLDRLIIDAYYNESKYPLLKLANKLLPASIVKTYMKYNPEISSEKVISSWKTGLLFKLGLALNKNGDYYRNQIAAYKRLAEYSIDYLKKIKHSKVNVYGLDTASVELFTWSKKNNDASFLVLEQCVASRKQQTEMYLNFQEKFGLSQVKKMIVHCSALRERELREWELADKILVPSDYVKKGIESEGIDRNKIELLHYGFSSSYPIDFVKEEIDKKFNDNSNKPITILFAGNAGFRKGLHDIISVASKLQNENIKFLIAGKIENEFSQLHTRVPGNIEFLGKISKSDLIQQYRAADVFLFPSYLEGSALVTFEAMSMGLPLITTSQAGSIVSNHIDGYIVNAGDINALKEKIQQLSNDKELRYRMSIKALQNVQNYSIEHYKRNLLRNLNNTLVHV